MKGHYLAKQIGGTLHNSCIANAPDLIFISRSPAQTRAIAGKLAKDFLKGKNGPRPLVIGLIGDLGSGKTTFIQGFARGLGVQEKVSSPTFVILKTFRLGPGLKFRHLLHVDCYRIRTQKELIELGFEEMVKDRDAIVVVEWADKILDLLPRAMRSVVIESSRHARKISVVFGRRPRRDSLK